MKRLSVHLPNMMRTEHAAAVADAPREQPAGYICAVKAQASTQGLRHTEHSRRLEESLLPFVDSVPTLWTTLISDHFKTCTDGHGPWRRCSAAPHAFCASGQQIL